MRRHTRGFSLMETMIVVLVIAIAAVAVLPTSSGDAPVTLQGASGSLAADLEYAQAQSVAHPDDPVVVVVDAANNAYHLARASSPQTPIERPGAAPGTPYAVSLAEGSDESSISLAASGVGAHIRFDSMGRLQQASDVVLTLINQAGRVDVFISAQTGDVSAVSDASSQAVVTQDVYTAPSAEQQAPADQPEQPVVAEALTETVEAVDALISGDASGAVSTATGTVAGVTVGVVSTTTTVVETTTTTVTNTVGGLLGGKK